MNVNISQESRSVSASIERIARLDGTGRPGSSHESAFVGRFHGVDEFLERYAFAVRIAAVFTTSCILEVNQPVFYLRKDKCVLARESARSVTQTGERLGSQTYCYLHRTLSVIGEGLLQLRSRCYQPVSIALGWEQLLERVQLFTRVEPNELLGWRTWIARIDQALSMVGGRCYKCRSRLYVRRI